MNIHNFFSCFETEKKNPIYYMALLRGLLGTYNSLAQ